MRIRLAVLLAVVAGHATVTAKMTGLSKTIELSGALTRVTTSFQFDSAERRSIELDDEHEGYAAATTGSDKRELGLERRHVDGKLELTTSDPVQSFTLNQVLAHRSTPDPPAQQQTEDIKMAYDLRPFDLLSVQDAQSLESMHIKVRCPSPRILDIVTPKGFKHAHTKGSATITITPTEPIASIDRQSSIKIRYVTNEPIASFTEYNRTVELSTYASNINVHDSLVLVNSGPTLKGQFARIDHQKAMMMRKPSTALNALSMALPPAAHDAYYYDTVGNVSTSRFTRGSGRRNAMIEFQPRYPIYGGWKYSFDIGWNLPLGYWEKREGPKRILRVDPFTPTRDLAIDRLVVNVRLPEGAKIQDVKTPYDFDVSYPTTPGSIWGVQQGYVKTYLDSIGRPVVTLERRNMTDRHLMPVFIEYELNSFDEYLRKPLTAAVVISLAYVAVALLRRMKWSIP